MQMYGAWLWIHTLLVKETMECIQEDEVLNIEKAPQNYHLTVTLYVPMWVCSE